MTGEIPFPPRRDVYVLQQWVDDFIEAGNTAGADIVVAEQDGDRRSDTGLVIVRLQRANGAIYMQPRAFDDPLWQMTVEVHETELTAPPYEMGALGAELIVASNLCTYLQYRSLEWDRLSGRHEN
ncbi:hypothetical protein ACO03V_08580 [Microbacterium sp. HMH0099]|uniref:hypothetical protein n=1 Tax=Microbacterium sp. HMH0099 TaxID=3414026 RepID=UPI003BF6DF54